MGVLPQKHASAPFGIPERLWRTLFDLPLYDILYHQLPPLYTTPGLLPSPLASILTFWDDFSSFQLTTIIKKRLILSLLASLQAQNKKRGKGESLGKHYHGERESKSLGEQPGPQHSQKGLGIGKKECPHTHSLSPSDIFRGIIDEKSLSRGHSQCLKYRLIHPGVGF